MIKKNEKNRFPKKNKIAKEVIKNSEEKNLNFKFLKSLKKDNKLIISPVFSNSRRILFNTIF